MARILLLTPQLPYPPHQGTSLRNFHIVRGLAETHQLSLLSFLEEGQMLLPDSPLHTLCQTIETVPVPTRSTGQRLRQLLTTRQPDMAHRLHSADFRAALARLLEKRPFDIGQFDIVQIEGIELARTIPLIRQKAPHAKIVFDNHNAETALQWRAMLADLPNPRRWLAAGYSLVQVGRLRQFERWACRAADWVTAVSDTDQAHLQQLLGKEGPPITAVPNSIDVTQYENWQIDEATPRFDLVFSGKMDYRPNIDAVLWFAETAWPQIVAERPTTTWAIVGQKPHPRLAHLAGLPGVTITGWVDAVQPYLAGASICLLPFRIGSGTRLKLIEAMASGKPIVSTSIGSEGFAVAHELDLLLAESGEEMATVVLRLLADGELRERLGENGRLFAQQFDWRVVVPQFNEIYQRLIGDDKTC
ncbi:MAG: glycosyltransferase [Chloroflexota bacterium]